MTEQPYAVPDRCRTTGRQAANTVTGPRPHLPQRPLWLCRNCVQPWPCGQARVSLTREYAEARTALRIHLATRMHEAIADLVRLNGDTVPSPAEFWRRFLAWVGPGNEDEADPAGEPAQGR